MLRNEVEAFLRTTGMSDSTFGRIFYGSPGFVKHLRQGRACREDIAAKIRAMMNQYLATRESNPHVKRSQKGTKKR